MTAASRPAEATARRTARSDKKKALVLPLDEFVADWYDESSMKYRISIVSETLAFFSQRSSGAFLSRSGTAASGTAKAGCADSSRSTTSSCAPS